MSDLPTGTDSVDQTEDEIEETSLEDEEIEAGEGDDPAEGEGDAGGDDAGGDEGEDAQRQARDVRRGTGRGSQRVRAVVNENRELKTKLAGFEQQLQTLLAERRAPTAAEQAAEAERERQQIEMMTPAEVGAYYHQKTLATVQQQTQQIAVGMWEQNDRRDFETTLRENPKFARFRDRVEELRKQAPGVPRDMLLDKAIGEHARASLSRATGRATRGATEGAARHTARPSRAGGDVPADRAGRRDSLEDRLRGQAI